MAGGDFRPERDRTRRFHIPEALDRRERGAFACPGRAAFALVSLHVQAGAFAQSAAGNPPASNPSQNETRGVSLRELCLLGITGGIVPCPAALVVLLSAFSLHRIGFGLFLITAFSLGLAAVLVMVGLTMVYTKRFMAPRVRAERSVVRYLPLLSSAFMVVLGVGIAVSAFRVGSHRTESFSPETNWSRLSRSRFWACFSECAIPPIPITWWPCLPS